MVRPALVLSLIAAVATAAAPALLAEAPRIVIDGRFDDWSASVPASEDPLDATESELDLTRIAITHDGDAVYVRLEFADEVLLQGLTGTATLLFDADGDRATGTGQLGVEGVDAAIVFSPPAPDWTGGARGIIARSVGSPGEVVGETLESYDLGVIVGPTHAASRFEIRLDRGLVLPGTDILFRDPRFSVGFAYVGPDGSIEERSDVLTYTFGPSTTDERMVIGFPDPLARAPGTDLRVLSWNVSAQSILDNAETFRRIFTALGPDVLLLDEVPAIDATALLDALALESPPGGAWSAAVGPGGGRQHAAVMSRFPVSLVPALTHVPYPEDFGTVLATVETEWIREDLANARTDGISTAGFVVELGERRLLAVPLDLQCCGRLGEEEDRIRQIQAEAIRAAVAAALPDLDVDGVVIAGDLNLVASRRPLDLLRDGLDVDASELAVLDAIQLDGRSAATWGFSGVFPHSRLDYFLYGDSTLEPLGGFVFDPRDLDEAWLEAHDLRAEDARVSGHLPIVADLRWIDSAPSD